MKMINILIKNIGFTGLIIILGAIAIYSYSIIKKKKRESNSEFIKGVSLGINKGAKGSRYLYYSFKVDNESYKGNVTTDFCKQCNNCCVPGDTVIVRYESGDPQNNDLVVQLPEGETLSNN
jgi:hypothetical protein